MKFLRLLPLLPLLLVSALSANDRTPPAPANLKGYEGHIGKSFVFRVTGASAADAAWGTDLYTLDSALAVAAVHAGAVANGASGVVRVTIDSGRSSYAGSAKNGVTTGNWAKYEASYRVEAAGADEVLADPGNLLSFVSGRKKDTFLFDVKGTTTGAVWGADYYTSDSLLATAAVHAGVLKVGERGVIRVTFWSGKPTFKGSAKNGVTTRTTGAYASSFKVDRLVGGVPLAPSNLTAFKDRTGQTFTFAVKGTAKGQVWGTDRYTLDSSLAAAALHAGKVRDGWESRVRVTVVGGADSFTGSTRNGVTSANWEAFPAAFTVDFD